MALVLTRPNNLQEMLRAQGLTCQLLLPVNHTDQNPEKIDRVIIHQAGPGSGFTEETAKLYRDILTQGNTAVLMYSPLSGRFGTDGVVEELSLIVKGVHAVYGHIDLATVATSGGQKVILRAAAAGVFEGRLKECVFINGILTPQWQRYDQKQESQINAKGEITLRTKGVKRSSPILACPARMEMGLRGFLQMAFWNVVGTSVEFMTGGYAFYNRLFYLGSGKPEGAENGQLRFLERHMDQEVYDILRQQYPINGGVFALSNTLYREDLTSALRNLAADGVRFFVVRGEIDGVVNNHQHEETLRVINEASEAEAKFLLIPGSSHMVDIENPELLRASLVDFFKRASVT